MAAGAKGSSARSARSAARSAMAAAARAARLGRRRERHGPPPGPHRPAPGAAMSAWIGAGQTGSRAHRCRAYRPCDGYSRCQLFQIHGHPPLCL